MASLGSGHAPRLKFCFQTLHGPPKLTRDFAPIEMKGFTLFLSLLAVAAALASGAMFILVRDNRDDLEAARSTAVDERDDAIARGDQLATEVQKLATELERAQAELNELKARGTTLEARNNQLAREITRMRDELTTRQQSDQGVSQQIAELNRQLIEARAASATTLGGASAEQVAVYQARIADLETQLAALRSATGHSGITPQLLERVPADLRGQVIDVGPESAFVVLDIGTRSGAVPSIEMVLRHGPDVVARVRLTDVREYYTIAHVLPSSGTGTIRPGDTATRS